MKTMSGGMWARCRRCAAVLGVAALVAAGCGGDDDAESPTTDAETPGTNAEAPTTDAQTPGTDADAPTTDAQTPGTDAETSTTDAETPGPTTEPADDGETPVPGGSATFLDSGGVPRILDPALSSFSRTGPGGAIGAMAAYSVYDSLIWVDYNTNEIVPRIAESVESNDDATVWTITLREGVQFTDGTPYDAAAVKYNWDRAKDPALASRCLSTVSSFMSVDIPDERTVVVTLPTASVGFPWLLQGCLSGVASPAALDEHGENYGTSPDTIVGAGAFIVTDFLPGDHVTYERNPDFWDNPRPYLDELTLRMPTTQSQALDAVISGTAQVAIVQNGALGTDYPRFLAEGSINRDSYGPLAGAIAYGFNTNRAPLDDVRVRKALVLAYDPDDFNEKVAGGAFDMAETYLSEDSIFFNPDVRQPTNDLVEAQALIDEYVAEHGPIELTILNSSSTAAWNVVMQQQWNRLENVSVEVTADDDATAAPKLISGDYQIGALNLGTDIDPETLFGRYHSSSTLNVLRFSDPQMDAWVEELRGAEDPARQQELVDEITKFLVMDQHWILQTYRVVASAAAGSQVHGFEWQSPRDIHPAALWIDS
jgi:peptide/nickel transport system substrate-binding protein